MSWSYSGDPTTSALDKYRFLLGDTNADAPLMQDEEINFIAGTYSSENKVMYELFNHAAVIFARDIKRSLGPQSEDPTSRLDFFQQKAEEYKALIVSASGLSVPSWASPKIFTKGMDDNPPHRLKGDAR